MLFGISLKANPTHEQRLILSKWMGCARFIWNAKCQEENYHTKFARKYFPIGTYAPIDQKYSHFKNKELSPWLNDVPSQILRNSAVNWYNTYYNFIKGLCDKPKKKPKLESGSIHLTKELFLFKECADGVTRLFVGTKKYNVGFLKVKNHKKYKKPDSIYIKKDMENIMCHFAIMMRKKQKIYLPKNNT